MILIQCSTFGFTVTLFTIYTYSIYLPLISKTIENYSDINYRVLYLWSQVSKMPALIHKIPRIGGVYE